MSTRTVLTIFVCAAMAAWASTAGSQQTSGGGGSQAGAKRAKPAKKCDADCSVPVVVETPSVTESLLTVADDFVTVGKGKKPKITWKLSTMNPAFQTHFGFDQSKGIDFGADQDQFDCAFAANDTYNCKVKHVNATLTVYKYAVNVKVLPGMQHGQPKPLDPWIVSE